MQHKRLVSADIPLKKIKCIQDKEGRFVLVQGKMETTEISLMNIYNSPVISPDFMIQLIEVIMTV